jgi:hypothetical protein
MRTLKEKVLGIAARGLVFAGLLGIPNMAYASSYDFQKSGFMNTTSVEYTDVNGDGLTDMIFSSKGSVVYYKSKAYGSFEKEQIIYSEKNPSNDKMRIALIRDKSKLNLIVLVPSGFKQFRLNDQGKFEEFEDVEWMDDEE